MLSGLVSVLARDGGKLAPEKWRPKNGTYAVPGNDFQSQCADHTDFDIDLAEKSISGNEWSCNINKIADTAPGAVRIDMVCDDYNLALALNPRDKKAEERKFKEVMLLKWINENALSVRRTLNGKFKGPSWQVDYCPEQSKAAVKDK
jgi:hypothetical protein